VRTPVHSWARGPGRDEAAERVGTADFNMFLAIRREEVAALVGDPMLKKIITIKKKERKEKGGFRRRMWKDNGGERKEESEGEG